MKMKIGRTKHERGMTLIELMMTVAITGMLMTTVALIMRDAFRAWFSQSRRLEMVRQSRLSMDMIIKQVHAGSATTVSIGSCSLSSPQMPYSMLAFNRWDAGTWQTRFYLNIYRDKDGKENGVLVYERPNFPVDSDTVTLTARTVLATGVANLCFTYPSWRMDNRIEVNLGLLRHKYDGLILTHQLREVMEFKNE